MTKLENQMIENLKDNFFNILEPFLLNDEQELLNKTVRKIPMHVIKRKLAYYAADNSDWNLSTSLTFLDGAYDSIIKEFLDYGMVTETEMYYYKTSLKYPSLYISDSEERVLLLNLNRLNLGE
jgi:hypothetical protein